jgi:predicted nucleic acid-binding Zn ribbon protein
MQNHRRIDTRARMNRVVCLKDEMDIFINYIGLDSRMQVLRILEVWNECVGEAISRYSTPVEIRRNKLFVSVENAVWRYELSTKKSEILDRINEKLNSKKKVKIIKEIVFV